MLHTLKRAVTLAVILLFSCLLLPDGALAAISFEGAFTATDNCEALVSIRKGTNPDNVRLQLGETYQVLGKNSDAGSHYLVQIDGANPPQRWVASGCLNATAATTASKPAATKPVTTVAVGKDYLLALSWQPAFCEGKPDKLECQNLAQNPDRPEATHFVLHGLWPQPRANVYCNVSKEDIGFDEGKEWSKLPAVEKELSPQTWERLQAAMPGTVSNLHRHEWIKHGTCYGGTAEEYFTESIALLNAFNNSPVQAVVANHIGRQVAIKDIDQALSSFVTYAGEKVEVKCNKQSALGEIWVNLEGDITPDTPVANLLANSPNAKPEKLPACLVDDARS